ncbi:uncharacterized protein LOC110993540 [Pieris rapae]|uniref:uncharacterized protein LOC110993540 n=1 Tax=Pieris rapae TaxID=64459 RepID=UPI001E280E8D|nr:uncharacterized protein LOC110993540 [Pieris rapae]
MHSDTTTPQSKDLIFFISKLKKTFYFNTKTPNTTDVNTAIGTYFVTAILQRTLLDHTQKMTDKQKRTIVNIINRGKYYLSHYIYNNKPFGYRDFEFRVSILYQDVDIFTHSINEFSERRLQKWILSDINMHSYVENLDDISLKKEMYISILNRIDDYNINIKNSDYCISSIIDTPQAINNNVTQLCRDDYCKYFLFNGPSIGYALSHRLLNIMLRRNCRRCHLQSPREDENMMDQLCAFIYREVVYLARRGYFARDIFLEHVGLCAIIGYKEFFRMHWFYKAASWMNSAGCIQENRNYLVNETKHYKVNTNDTKKLELFTKRLKQTLLNECHDHEITVLSVVLAHAIRYTAKFMQN